MERNSIGGVVFCLVLAFSCVGCTKSQLTTVPGAQIQRRPPPSSTPVTSSPPPKGIVIMTDLNRQELTQRAAPLGPPVHTVLEKPETVVERVPSQFFKDGAIYRVSTRPPERPRTYVLGVWGNDGIKLLNADPEAFFELAASSGLKLASGSDYVDYVITFMESTRDFRGGPQILKTIEESWWLQSPSPEEMRKREEIIAKYAKVIEAPKLSDESDATVIVYAIINRKLLRLNAKVEGNGQIKISETILEPEMPTVMLN